MRGAAAAMLTRITTTARAARVFSLEGGATAYRRTVVASYVKPANWEHPHRWDSHATGEERFHPHVGEAAQEALARFGGTLPDGWRRSHYRSGEEIRRRNLRELQEQMAGVRASESGPGGKANVGWKPVTRTPDEIFAAVAHLERGWQPPLGCYIGPSDAEIDVARKAFDEMQRNNDRWPWEHCVNGRGGWAGFSFGHSGGGGGAGSGRYDPVASFRALAAAEFVSAERAGGRSCVFVLPDTRDKAYGDPDGIGHFPFQYCRDAGEVPGLIFPPTEFRPQARHMGVKGEDNPGVPWQISLDWCTPSGPPMMAKANEAWWFHEAVQNPSRYMELRPTGAGGGAWAGEAVPHHLWPPAEYGAAWAGGKVTAIWDQWEYARGLREHITHHDHDPRAAWNYHRWMHKRRMVRNWIPMHPGAQGMPLQDGSGWDGAVTPEPCEKILNYCFPAAWPDGSDLWGQQKVEDVQEYLVRKWVMENQDPGHDPAYPDGKPNLLMSEADPDVGKWEYWWPFGDGAPGADNEGVTGGRSWQLYPHRNRPAHWGDRSLHGKWLKWDVRMAQGKQFEKNNYEAAGFDWPADKKEETRSYFKPGRALPPNVVHVWDRYPWVTLQPWHIYAEGQEQKRSWEAKTKHAKAHGDFDGHVAPQGHPGHARTNQTNVKKLRKDEMALQARNASQRLYLGLAGDNPRCLAGDNNRALFDPPPGALPGVVVVRSVEDARECLAVMKAADLVHERATGERLHWAVDTEVADFDAGRESPVQNGVVTCVSVSGGPDVDFGPRLCPVPPPVKRFAEHFHTF